MLKHINEDEFETEVLNKNGVFIVDFYATWCGPCMMLSPILEEVARSRAKYNIMKIDVDKNQELSNRLNIDTIPTLCIYKDGKLVNKHIGYMSKEDLIEFIENNY